MNRAYVHYIYCCGTGPHKIVLGTSRHFDNKRGPFVIKRAIVIILGLDLAPRDASGTHNFVCTARLSDFCGFGPKNTDKAAKALAHPRNGPYISCRR